MQSKKDTNMLLQKMRHSQADMCENNLEKDIMTHGVTEITCGGEYTICGRAIPDSLLEFDGYEAVGHEFRGSMRKCDCLECIKIIRYFKNLR